jgi:hypothetical protein
MGALRAFRDFTGYTEKSRGLMAEDRRRAAPHDPKVFGVIAYSPEDIDITLGNRGPDGTFGPIAEEVSRDRVKKFSADALCVDSAMKASGYACAIPPCWELRTPGR